MAATSNVAYLRQTDRRRTNLRQAEKTTYYRFVEPDPVMMDVGEAISQAGWSISQVVKEAYKVSGGACNLHWQTVERWLDGRTKRPQHWNVMWVMRALGYEEHWVRVN